MNWSPEYYEVRAGDTVYSIAKKYDLRQQDLIRWNNLGSGAMIREGQKLRLRPPGGAKSAGTAGSYQKLVPPPAWRWPVDGRLLLGYGASVKTESGIRIGGNYGQAVRAVASGEVVYAGSGLASYGQLLIIKHNESWLSAYGFNSALLVAEGSQVRSGQPVARMGRDKGGTAQLHFEIRRNGEPVNPLLYLPRR